MATSLTSNRTDEPEKIFTAEEEQEIIRKMGWKALFSFTTRKHIPGLFTACAAGAIAALTLPAMAIVFGVIFRQFADFGAGKLSAADFLSKISKYCTYLTAMAGLSWARSARDRIFNALLTKNMAWYDTRQTGIATILPGISMQIRDLQISVSQPSDELVQCTVQAAGSMPVAFYSSWNLTLVVICSTPLAYLAMACLSKLLSKRAHDQSDKLQQALKYVTDAIRSIETVKCFNGERFEVQRYTTATGVAGRLYKKLANIRSLQLGIMQFFTLSILVQGFWYGSTLVFNGQKNAGQVPTTFWAALLAVTAVTDFLPQFIVVQKGKIAAARLQALMNTLSSSETMMETGGWKRPARCIGRIHFEDVSFAYPSRPDQPALRNISITLGQLLVRFYQASSGVIHFDDISLQDLDVHWLRENITLVEQYSVLFNDSIRRNIALGKLGRDATPEEIEEAVTFAMMQQMMADLPDGLDTLLDPHGNNPSGGQRQRVALARARLRDTPVLILDESTSALDYITRSAIISAIRAWRDDKITIIITRDITQVNADDLFYVMGNARVVQGVWKVLEEDPRSSFHTLVEFPESDETDEGSPLDDKEVIISWYSGSRNSPELPSRPSSATFFNQSILSPLFSLQQSSVAAKNRVSMADATSLGPSLATDGYEQQVLKPRPGGFPQGFGTRPNSVIQQHSPSPFEPMYRPVTILYPEQPTELESDVPSYRKTFRAKMERRRKRRSNIEEPAGAVESLEIMQIIKSVWPLVGWPTRLALIAAVCCSNEHRRMLSRDFGVSIVDGFATYGYNALFDMSAQTGANALKAEGMKRILVQPREFFDREENSVSRIAESLDQFTEEARNLHGRFVGIVTVLIFCICIAFIWSLVSSWKLTLMALPCLAIMHCITRIFNAVSNRRENFSSEAEEHVGQALHETFVNIRTVRCLVLEEVFRKKYKETTLKALKIGIKRSLYSGSIFGLNYASTFFMIAFLFWWGAYIVSRGDFRPPISFNILLLSVGHVSHIGNYIPQINVARDAGSRLIRLARLPQDSHELGGTDQIFNAGDIALENVLYNVSFDIPRGSCTATVESSGSGKSTIAALLLMLYPTTTGPSKYNPDISISSQDIKRVHTSTLRSRIGIVSQTPFLFPGTIAENITYGLSSSSPLTRPENIRVAADAAGVADFIDSLPQGYHTIVGDGGTGLPGGQAQRIPIARAFVRDPYILILDEATSALDVESAGIVRDTIHQLVKQS
ncbi:hypothetical protein K458DRAFT_438228 [Lentithecium fluviatile CBS 122367]|uniref:P-loop containing nucleoside triphosphate hydrolase protein n=1 Tax=Lentithecium fluviatile CBS 122367 TaxID=1168545 RepID=A0A6G1JN50_9PLEO|nr:hypothetical protein K458DRAFT_438228 [Lentithecium fluviatile CBS 122367]